MEKWLTLEQVLAHPEASDEELKQAMDTCVAQVLHNMPAFEEHFPDANSINNFYTPGSNPYSPGDDWTSGFWTGEVWLAYEYEKDKAKRQQLRTAGEKQVKTFLRRIREKDSVNHHDMGFLYSPSCVAAYKLIGSEEGKEAAILAADNLMTRYQPNGEYLQAWGDMNADRRLIIDCLLNLPILYWATEVTGDSKYRDVAEKHIHTAMKYVVREDFSTWHTILFDAKTGAYIGGKTAQGYKDSSAWTRGQSWGVYGTAVAYKNTHREEYIRYFKGVSDYFLTHLPEDITPYWDLSFGNDDPEEPKDASASAIVACGFLEMSKYLPEEDAKYYVSLARKLMHALIQGYQVKDPAVSNGQLLHCVYAKQSPYNTVTNRGVDECVTWGDYYFMEALTRLLNPDWNIYW